MVTILNSILSKQDKHRLLQQTQNVGRLHPIFCIPVGQNPDLVQSFTFFNTTEFVRLIQYIQNINS